MENLTGTAYFLRNARTVNELENYKHQCIEKQIDAKAFAVSKIIRLSRIDYENFTTDLLVDRQFIQDNIEIMYVDENNIWNCLLIVQKDNPHKGVLVESKKKDYAMYLAIYQEQTKLELL